MDNRYQNPYGQYPGNPGLPPYYNVPPGPPPPPPDFQQGGKKSSKWKITFGSLLGLIPVFLLLLILITVVFVGRPYGVTGQSMYPTLEDGNRVFVVPYRGNTTPSRGDVVVLKNVPGSDELLIKRVVAIQGDRIAIGDGKLVVNGVYEHKNGRANMQETVVKQVPEGMVYVMGDNELHSFDSRTFGPVSMDSVVGRALFIWWPFSDWKKL